MRIEECLQAGQLVPVRAFNNYPAIRVVGGTSLVVLRFCSLICCLFDRRAHHSKPSLSLFGMANGRSSGECDADGDCRDPAWGGEGTCNPSSDLRTCLCDDGFASRDALGHASCVPRRVLVAGYAVLAVASLFTTAILVWQANRFRYLPAGMSASPRRTLTRLRALVFSRQVILLRCRVSFISSLSLYVLAESSQSHSFLPRARHCCD